jgi:AraC-like DNA-binding protein
MIPADHCPLLQNPEGIAISQSVGFKSRSAFVTAFKRFTGLTPSEYLRVAKEK